jgi:hypothetical protein
MESLIVESSGEVRAIYSDRINAILTQVGAMKIKRASNVDPEDGKWFADLSLSGGPKLGPFNLREDAIAAEVNWLKQNRGL